MHQTSMQINFESPTGANIRIDRSSKLFSKSLLIQKSHCYDLRPAFRMVPVVMPYNYPALCGFRNDIKDICTQALRCLKNRQIVHSRPSCLHFASETCQRNNEWRSLIESKSGSSVIQTCCSKFNPLALLRLSKLQRPSKHRRTSSYY